jgi:hypothetical protein
MNERTKLSALSAASVRGRRAGIDRETQKPLVKSTCRIARNWYGACANEYSTVNRGGEWLMRRHFYFCHCEPRSGEAIQSRGRIGRRIWIASSAFGLLAMTNFPISS